MEKTVDTILVLLGTTYSLTDIRNVLGVIILVVQLVWFGSRLVLQIIDRCKTGETAKIDADVNTFIEDIKKLSDSLGDEDDNTE